MLTTKRVATAVLAVLAAGAPMSAGHAAGHRVVHPAGHPADQAADLERARAHVRAGRWGEAAEAYAAVVDGNPYQGLHWSSYALALLRAGRYDEAATAWHRALEIGTGGQGRQHTLYNIACAHSLAGRADEAIEWLDRAMRAGLMNQRDLIGGDRDLDPIRDHPRFREVTMIDAPPGLDRDAGSRHDLAVFARQVRQCHYDFDRVLPADRLEAAVARLHERVPALRDHEIVVELQRILARLGDAHTTALRRGLGGWIRGYPVRLYRYADGLHVRAAAPELSHVVGLEVIRLGNASIETAYEAVSELVSRDNEMWIEFVTPSYLAIPEVLDALRLVDDMERAPLVVRTAEGEEITVTLEPTTAPPGRRTDARLVHINAGAVVPEPLHLQRRDEFYWFEHLAEHDLVYCQYNVCRDRAEEPLSEFVPRLIDFIEEHEVDFLVLDLRHNGGGTSDINPHLIHGVIRCDRVNRPGHLYTIIGRNTFSAAQNCATDLDTSTATLFVGEPTGSRPNFVGEGNPIFLPYSGFRFSCSNRYHQHAFVSDDDRTWLAPDIAAPLSSAMARENHDPCLAAILRAISARRAASGRP